MSCCLPARSHPYFKGLVLACLLFCLAALFLISNRVYAEAESENVEHDSHEVYLKLKKGERVWKDKLYAAPQQPTVYLTFDDGPSKLTGQVLDILQKEDIKATFFVLGKQVEAYPDLLKRAVAEGHAIGNHTYNHVYGELYKGFSTFWEQIGRTEDILAETAGIRPSLIRAPGGTFGNFDAFYFYYLDQAGYEVHDWHIDSGDSKRVGVPSAEIIQTVRKGPFGDEVIVLMHDGTGHEQTVKALPEIIRMFKEKGYTFAALQPSVKPMHFAVGSLKQSRTMGEAMYEKLSAEARQHELTMESLEQSKQSQQAAADEMTSASSLSITEGGRPISSSMGGDHSQLSVPLEVFLGRKSLMLDSEHYRLKEGQYQVPLRQLMESLGATVEWRGEQRTAIAHYGPQTLEYDFARQELRIRQYGILTTIHLPQMELKDGTVYVPLRGTLDKLGIGIGVYGLDDGVMKVHVDRKLRFLNMREHLSTTYPH
ncbi:Peptidoglycan/xylan/chitin deacetylase, PgdA/CDA1 family [Paenibacillus sp. 1_12]|uniref:polysaccharide deacetylase n=1 Tax=Paenibacillus sp. 1_12 TaxID=1566278 RepID=UPI0008DF62CD|nr:polysaccharide deacetylase [Paenibacillus sp. 1_12]SFM12144.1 Peptidoglycan/xylan/chitin deacetylase, PgdA/CDA1 family [Paenibacillus sp. 1_12]